LTVITCTIFFGAILDYVYYHGEHYGLNNFGFLMTFAYPFILTHSFLSHLLSPSPLSQLFSIFFSLLD